MKQITTLIIDDEKGCLESLATDLKAYPQIKVIGMLDTAEKAVESIQKKQPSLLFLDIEMEPMNGIELLKQIEPQNKNNNLQVIFYSAYGKYQIDAIRHSAFDFLLKPYTTNELDFVVNRVIERFEKREINFQSSVQQLIGKEGKFTIQTDSHFLFLHPQEVLYFERKSEERAWQVHLCNQNYYNLRTVITSKEILPLYPSFTQVSQQFIINMDYIYGIDRETLQCMFYPPYEDIIIHASKGYFSKVKDDWDIF